MTKAIVFFIVFVVTLLLANSVLSAEYLLIKLLISGLTASIAFWFISVRNEEQS